VACSGADIFTLKSDKKLAVSVTLHADSAKHNRHTSFAGLLIRGNIILAILVIAA
jgi:hypothetical protein